MGWLPPHPPGDPCLDADHCRKLAQIYVAACARHRDLGAAHMEIRYEHLLENPADAVRTLAAFAVGDVSENRLAAAAALVRRSPSAASPTALSGVGVK